MRFDYAWKWFNFHADQRTKMFNYMLLGLSLFATAIVTAVKEKLYCESSALALAAAVLAFVFARIDRRNRSLYEAALGILFEFERDFLFSGKHEYYPLDDASNGGKAVPYAISWRIFQEDRAAKKASIVGEPFWLGRHRFWMPTIIYGLGVFFLAAAGWTWSRSDGCTRSPAIETPPAVVCCRPECPACPLPPVGGHPASLLASARVGGFDSGRAEMRCEAMRNETDAVRATVAEALGRGHGVFVVLVGSADRDPLTASLRSRYESNAGLARARISAVELCLDLGASSKDPSRLEVLRVVSGPSFTPPGVKGPDDQRQGKAGDRDVRITVVSVPVAPP